MQQFDPFGREEQQLICISSNDVSPDTVRQDTLTAVVRGKQFLRHFINQRLVADAQMSLYDPIKKNKSLTFSSMRTISVKTPSGPRIIKSDKKLFQRLLSASSGGRVIDFDKLLRHELHPVPPALMAIDGSMLITDKSALSYILGDQDAVTLLPRI